MKSDLKKNGGGGTAESMFMCEMFSSGSFTTLLSLVPGNSFFIPKTSFC